MAEGEHARPEGLVVCEQVSAGWGETLVLSDISFNLPAGETLAVLGRNGVGKSTLLSTIAGRAALRNGSISFLGRDLAPLSKYQRARAGIGLVPQEREIFPSLSVRENLSVAAKRAADGNTRTWTLDRIYDLFPRLKERRSNLGSQLSGGEQQMLSIGRALMGDPSLLLLDEPMEGLAPVIIELLIEALDQIRAESHLAILLVEQHAGIALEFARRLIVLDRGAIVYNNADGSHLPDRLEIERLIGIETVS